MIKKAGSVLGTALEAQQLIVKRILQKLLNIVDNTEHTLHDTVIKQQRPQAEASLALQQCGLV